MPVASSGCQTTVRGTAGQRAVERLCQRYPGRPVVPLVPAPTHASWVDQVEIYFSSRRERSSLRMISRTWTSSPSSCWIFHTTGNRRRSRSIGSSHARTARNFSASSTEAMPCGRLPPDSECTSAYLRNGVLSQPGVGWLGPFVIILTGIIPGGVMQRTDKMGFRLESIPWMIHTR